MSFIDSYQEKISLLCNEHMVEKLYLFGSAAKNTLNESSDVDFVVKFKTIDLANYFKNYMSFKNKLKGILHREVDLLEEQTISNPYIKESIDGSKQLIYG
jgi:uncharacterized protein